MVLPDLLEVQPDCSLCVEHCVSGDKVHMLCNTVNDYYNCVIAMHLKKLHNEVNADDIPSIFWSLCGVELSIGSTVLQLSSIA
jgi:hypothetical protein